MLLLKSDLIPNPDKAFISLQCNRIWGRKHVAPYEDDAVTVLVVAVCVRSLLIPSTAFVNESVVADQKAVANIIPALKSNKTLS